MWLKTVGLIARTLATGASRRSTWWRRAARTTSLPGLLEHLAGQLAALDASFLEADSVEGTSDEWMIERADGYLTSVADVITVGDTAIRRASTTTRRARTRSSRCASSS